MERPEFITDEHLEYLDVLRESGATNMHGAGSYIRNAFEVDRQQSNEILTYWMQSFGNPDR